MQAPSTPLRILAHVTGGVLELGAPTDKADSHLINTG
jgi:hypothetical protein